MKKLWQGRLIDIFNDFHISNYYDFIDGLLDENLSVDNENDYETNNIYAISLSELKELVNNPLNAMKKVSYYEYYDEEKDETIYFFAYDMKKLGRYVLTRDNVYDTTKGYFEKDIYTLYQYYNGNKINHGEIIRESDDLGKIVNYEGKIPVFNQFIEVAIKRCSKWILINDKEEDK